MFDKQHDSTDQIVGLYSGLKDKDSFSRGVRICESNWNKEVRVGTLDDLLYEQLLSAEKEGRFEIVLVDIGSGDASLFSSFLNDSSVGEKTRSFLKLHPHFKIKMVGLTDAPSSAQTLQPAPMRSIKPDSIHPQIEANNLFYSLTVNQRLTDFLDRNSIQNIDLCVSTWALTYLGSNTFAQVISDILEKLRENGGKFICAAFAERETPGFKRIDPSLPHSLDAKNIDHSKPSLKVTMSDSLRPYRKGVDLKVELNNLRLAEQKLIRLGALTQLEVDEAEREFQQRISDWGESEMDHIISLREGATLAPSIEKLAKRKQTTLRERKIEILDKIKSENSDTALINIGAETMQITKK